MLDKKALAHLRQDPVMATLIQMYEAPIVRQIGTVDLFPSLIETIIGQQLSVKVADILTLRFQALLQGRPATAVTVLSLSDEALRACGISFSKIGYIKGICAAVLAGELRFENLAEISDVAVMAELIKLKGIGQWTAEMFLIFSLQRPDVFSVGDLGLRTAVARLYGLDRQDLIGIKTLAQGWSPFRSLACMYLWKVLDNAPKKES